MKVDIITDLFWGDSGKGKIAYNLAKLGGYNFITKNSGGGNCGHSFYHNDKLVKTHQVPCGVFLNIPSVICSGCVVEPDSFLEEIEYVKSFGVENVERNLKIAYNAHIVEKEYIEDDKKNDKVGSTGRGIMPAYRAKYGRVGKRAENCEALKDFICDPYELFDDSSNILVEGSQGLFLDIDYGDYPFISSHSTTSYYLHSLGVSPRNLNNVFGIIKAYSTYVGSKNFQPSGEIYNKIAEIGNEYGATTGRRRQVSFLDLNMLLKAIKMNGVNKLIINKMDILSHPEVNTYKIIVNGEVVDLETEANFKTFLRKFIPADIDITYSYSPKEI